MVKKMTIRLVFHWVTRIIENVLAPVGTFSVIILNDAR